MYRIVLMCRFETTSWVLPSSGHSNRFMFFKNTFAVNVIAPEILYVLTNMGGLYLTAENIGALK